MPEFALHFFMLMKFLFALHVLFLSFILSKFYLLYGNTNKGAKTDRYLHRDERPYLLFHEKRIFLLCCIIKWNISPKWGPTGRIRMSKTAGITLQSSP